MVKDEGAWGGGGGGGGGGFRAKPNARPFGIRRDPSNSERLTNFLEFALRRLFGIWLAIYADDCFTIEPQGAASNRMGIIVDFASLLGLERPPSYQIGPTASARLLGDKVTFLPGGMRAAVSGDSAE